MEKESTNLELRIVNTKDIYDNITHRVERKTIFGWRLTYFRFLSLYRRKVWLWLPNITTGVIYGFNEYDLAVTAAETLKKPTETVDGFKIFTVFYEEHSKIKTAYVVVEDKNFIFKFFKKHRCFKNYSNAKTYIQKKKLTKDWKDEKTYTYL